MTEPSTAENAITLPLPLLSNSRGRSRPTVKHCQSSSTRGDRRNATLPYRRTGDLGWMLTVTTLSKTQRVDSSLRLDVRNSTSNQYPDIFPLHKSCELKSPAGFSAWHKVCDWKWRRSSGGLTY